MPTSRDAGRLGCVCSAAATALRAHVLALRADLSLGAEPGRPLVVLPLPPGCGAQPPLPLHFTYMGGDAALAAAGGMSLVTGSSTAGGSATGDDGCGPNCECCAGGPYDRAEVDAPYRADTPSRRRGCTHIPAAQPCGCGVVMPGGEPAYVPAALDGETPSGGGGGGAGGGAGAGAGEERTGGGGIGDVSAGRRWLLRRAPGPDDGAAGFVLECGPACACAPARTEGGAPRGAGPLRVAGQPGSGSQDGGCPAQLTQYGLGARVRLRWQPDKGWCGEAAEPIPAGTFVSTYGGQYVTTAEATVRLRQYDNGGEGHALLVVREVLPSGLALRTNIDATRLGNAARFFNHSCDGGNLALQIVRRRGCPLPAVALFASRDIAIGEELTFAYGSPNRGAPESALESAHGRVRDGFGASGSGAGVHVLDDCDDEDRADGAEAVGVGGGRKAAPGGGGTGAGGGSAEEGRGPAAGGPSGPRRPAAGSGRCRQAVRCRCGTPACLGFMPGEDV